MASPVRDTKAFHQSRGFADVFERGRGHLVSRNPSTGQFALTTQVGGIGWHFGSGPFDAAHEVNTAWQPSTGAWQYEMVLADYNVHARNVFNAGNLIEYRDPTSQEWVIFDPQSLNWVNQDNSRQQIAIKQAVAAVVNDDILAFPGGYGPGRHFQYQTQTGRLQKLITIDSAGDLPAPTVTGTIWLETEFSLSTSAGVDIYLDGVRWAKDNNVRVRTANRIEFRDAATGTQVVWWLDFPRAWDSNPDGNETIGEFEVRRQGGPGSLFITVRIPKSWVDGAMFPIFIDPTIDVQVAATADDGGWNEDSLGFGTTFQQNFLGDEANTEANVFAYFTVTIPVGATIDAAYLELRAHASRNDDIDFHIYGHDAANAAAPTSEAECEAAPVTTANIAVVWTINTTAGTFYQMPSMVTVIQELEDSYDYSSGARIGFLLKSDGQTFNNRQQWTDYTNAAANAPKLHIEYTAGGVIPALDEGMLVGGLQSLSGGLA